MDAAKSLGSRIRLIRKSLGLTQIQVSQAAGLSPLGFQKIERGESFPKLASLESIARALKVKPTDLMASTASPSSEAISTNRLDEIVSRNQEQMLTPDEEKLIELARMCDKRTLKAVLSLVQKTVFELNGKRTLRR